MKRAAALLAAAVLAHPAAAQTNVHRYAPPPSWNDYRRIAEAEIVARLIDPESARISWTTGYGKGSYKEFLGARVEGYVACGEVNARNRMGGYTGASWFLVVIDYDRVLTLIIDKGAGVAAGECQKKMREGQLPRVPAGTAVSASTDVAAKPPQAMSNTFGGTAGSASGMTLQAMPDGAYIGAVAPGSPAAAAELKPGMVIASVNAIPLAGMGDAMIRVVDAAGPTAELTIVGGRSFNLGKRP